MSAEEPRRTGEAARPGTQLLRRVLRQDVVTLAADIGERNLRDGVRARRLRLARDYLLSRLEGAGCPVRLHPYVAGGERVDNLEVEVPGTGPAGEVVVVGAHYDSARGSPGANDNATGVAVLLALATAFHTGGAPRPGCTLRLVAFATEEEPFTRTPEMGSFLYAHHCHARGERVRAMLSLETLGVYARGHRWPEGPFPLNRLAPMRGDFFAVVGNLSSRALVRRCVETFPRHLGVRCRGVVLPGTLPGVRASDHWSFWQYGAPAVMVTDTAGLRSRHFHRASDRPERVDFSTLAEVTTGLLPVLGALAGVG